MSTPINNYEYFVPITEDSGTNGFIIESKCYRWKNNFVSDFRISMFATHVNLNIK